MNRKIKNICVIVFALVFLIGLLMINSAPVGKAGLAVFSGYNLSAFALLAGLCTAVTSIVLKAEIKKNEK